MLGKDELFFLVKGFFLIFIFYDGTFIYDLGWS